MTNNKFFKIFTKYQSTLINIGASIVIIGLIFKINHYPGAEIGIALGLGTEAVLFFILGIIAYANPEEELDHHDQNRGTRPWDDIKIELDKDSKAKIEAGLKNFANNLAAISAAADAAAVTNEFATKVKAASATFDQVNATLQQVSANLSKLDVTPITHSMDDAKKVQEEIVKLSKNLAALNAVYGNMLTAMNQPRN
jgi:hypothetical protein